MIYLDMLETFAAACRAHGKWGLYVSSETWLDEAIDNKGATPSCPILSPYGEHGQAGIDGMAVLLFDTEDEMLAAFRRVIGDDGPRLTPDYRTYALTCSPEGNLLSENT